MIAVDQAAASAVVIAGGECGPHDEAARIGDNGRVTESLILDALLVLVLVAYIVYGFRHGLSRSIFTIAGIVVGLIAAFFLAPVIANLVPIPFLHLGVTVVVAIGFVALGHAL